MAKSTIRWIRSLCLIGAGVSMLAGTFAAAEADVVGRVRFHLSRQRQTGGLPRATILLDDSAGIRPSVSLTTNDRGEAISPPLENRVWRIRTVRLDQAETTAARPSAQSAGSARPEKVSRDGSAGTSRPVKIPDDLAVRVAADAVTDVTLVFDPKGETLTRIEGADGSINPVETADVTRRDQEFLRRFPVQGGNPQSLQRVIRTVPLRGR